MAGGKKIMGRCIAHGGGRRCKAPQGCTKSAQRSTDYCVAHGGGKRCAYPAGCDKSAQHSTDYCVNHGGGRRCKAPQGCTRSAQQSTDYCVAHGGGRRCAYAGGCDRSAQHTTQYCVTHGGGMRCASCGLFSVKAQGFLCWTCRRGTARQKQYEAMVLDHLAAHPRLHAFTYHDQTLPCSPNQRRPDLVWVLTDRIVVLEVDEHAHRHYNPQCEIARITELQEQAGAMPLFLVRFNPKPSLLHDMARAVETCLDRTLSTDTLLSVAFVGYDQEYDVLQEIEHEAERRMA